MPKHLKLEDADAICWVQIPTRVNYERRCAFFDGSLGRPDPRFHHIVVVPDRIPGFERHYLVAYFDAQGGWVAQSSFDTLQGAIDHGRHAFELEDWQWHWLDTEFLRECDVHS